MPSQEEVSAIEVNGIKHAFELLTWFSESPHALISTPTVRNITLRTCNGLYRLPRRTPATIVVTLPKLRRMICTGTLILYANAQLLSMLIPKNIAAINAHLDTGTRGERNV